MDSENTLNKILNQIKEKYNIEKILIEEEYLSIAEYNNINSIFATELLKSRTIREVKFDYEVELLQKAADIVVDTID
jgi:Xaa-Pro aminopeptidase